MYHRTANHGTIPDCLIDWPPKCPVRGCEEGLDHGEERHEPCTVPNCKTSRDHLTEYHKCSFTNCGLRGHGIEHHASERCNIEGCAVADFHATADHDFVMGGYRR